MRYSIKLSYSGAGFHGWQIQPKDCSVQETLETSLSTLLGEEIKVTGAGRTDSGVNAVGYVAHFDCSKELDPAHLRYKLNAILPRSVTIHSIFSVPEDFHARFHASSREYTYFLHRVKDPFIENYSFFYPFDLNVDAMNKAAKLLKGTHDFSCFEKIGADNKTSICTVTEASWNLYTPTHVSLMGFEAADYLYFRISADRFLRNMVRATVGTLIEVGRGKRTPESIIELMNSGDRCEAGESVPGNALFLSKVEY